METRRRDRIRPRGPRNSPFECPHKGPCICYPHTHLVIKKAKSDEPATVYSHFATEVYPDPTPTFQRTPSPSPSIPSGIVGMLTDLELQFINGPCPSLNGHLST